MSDWIRRGASCALVLLSSASLGACAGPMPDDLGLQQGRLAPCPASPNCVSSEASDEVHSIAPLRLAVEPQQAWTELVSLLEGMPRVRIVTRESGYLHAEFETPLMGYVDDVELLLDPDAQAIAVRSASRVGYGDMGANRARIEQIRDELAGRGVVEPSESPGGES